ncbi:MarR family transcriptional regulator [Glutamicibacter mishrai]|uniref:MarR family transcriptional regulator n=2 Tax=Glutamicibacter mishrai TaxID=1775880 RepID=A0A6H0SMY7_9MICC|nr:MarR family transcriptional regulator [Glutamicibacter mishrai]
MKRPQHEEMRALLLKARQRVEVDALDYKRTLKAAAGGMTQREMAALLGMSQPAVAKALQRAQAVPAVVGEFNAASPYEMCQRYAAGFIDRAEVVRLLVEWPYKPTSWANEYGEYEESLDGTWDEVGDALRHELIDAAIYDEVLMKTAD